MAEIDVPLRNYMTMMASTGKTFNETKLSDEYLDEYNAILDDLETIPEGKMLALPNEWVGDEYGELVDKIVDSYVVSKAKFIGNFSVNKADGVKRYTLGAMYIPDMEDAHGEWTDSEELQRAVWDYVRTNDRRIRLQHNRDVVAGEWVEVMAFPHSLTVPITTPEGKEEQHTYPANTVFLGVIWEPWAWEMVQQGKIRGYSIGGKAERLFVDMEVDKSEPSVNEVHIDTIMNPKKPKDKIYEDKR